MLDQLTGYRERQMPDPTQLDLTYDFILRTFVKHGQAPHFTDIGRAFGVSPDEGRRLLHDLMAAGLPNWLFPSTDLIASFAPFNNVPTHYRISIGGLARRPILGSNSPLRKGG